MKGDFFNMKSVCIKTNNKYIIDYLLKEFSCIELDSIYLSNHSFKIYNNVIIHYSGKNLEAFEEVLCDILTRCIIFFYERKIFKNIIYYNYFYFNDIEKQQILDTCVDTFHSNIDLYTEKYDKLCTAIKQYTRSTSFPCFKWLYQFSY